MQSDMHYYGVYCLARAAGVKKSSATTIAYTSQYIDDSNVREITDHEDGSKVISVATAHHTTDIKNIDHDDQRHIWVPFHFLPGGEGESFTEKLMCVKNSSVAQEMVKNNTAHSLKYIDYGLELMGITAHVYADTFAHYGFSGVSSRRNRIEGDTLSLHQSSAVVESMLGETVAKWIEKHGEHGGFMANIRSIISAGAELATGALGHGGVSIYPDQPYLSWGFDYEYPSDSIGKTSKRNNQQTYIEACEHLYNMFAEFADLSSEHYDGDSCMAFSEISDTIKEILTTEGDKIERANVWRQKMANGELLRIKDDIPVYNSDDWHNQYEEFTNLTNPADFATMNVYKFFQAASYHKHYVLRELLPKKGIIVI